ncbi:hypothetical protein [Sphingosinicella rhizophila]|uniref:Fe-S oxidoreductase n=1 Tax=Sphingosinicella rhizophila TaxID=3050082 RepID=A0ABU3QC60_9SPHN|nr:hypothetical protein [Sphingosinicella sp. GR2756]MDT9600739.1 hypothetical protein [Sphingosinicella sp. GR2756]
MKILIAAAALSLSGIALAQTTPAEEPMAEDQMAQPSGETVDDPSQATGPAGITQQNTDPDGQAVAPPGVNQGMQPVGMVDRNALTPRAATMDYPACSRTVTDNCVQKYEKGRRPN